MHLIIPARRHIKSDEGYRQRKIFWEGDEGGRNKRA